jgi:biotin carboxylase
MSSGVQGKRLLVLGAGPWQGWLLKTARQLGIETYVVDGNPRARWRTLAHHFFPVDVKDAAQIVKLAEDSRVDGAITSSSDISLPSLQVLKRELRLPGFSDFPVENSVNKFLTHKLFDRAGIPSSRYRLLQRREDADALIREIGYPVVFKPLANSGGRGVVVIREPSEIPAGYTYTRQFSSNDEILIEAFLEGAGVGVETVVWDGTIHSSFIIDDHFIPDYISPIGHSLPTNLPPAVQEDILGHIRTIIRTFQMTFGNFNIDLKLTREGPKFLEINPRLGGANISELIYHSTGINIAAYALHLALGEPLPPAVPTRSVPAVSCLLSTRERGTVLARLPIVLTADESARVLEYEITVDPSSLVGTASKLTELIGWAIVSSQQKEINWAIIQQFLSHSHLKIDVSTH